MANLIGNGADQISTNGMLGTLAFQDHKAVNIEGGKIGGVDVATIASTVLTGEETDSINSSTNLVLRGGGVNLLTYSEDFSNAAWVKTNSTVTSNAAVAPDGTTTADKMVETATASVVHVINQTYATTQTSFCCSIYVKAAERSRINLRFDDNASTNFRSYTFDLSSGSTSSGSDGVSGTLTSSAAFITNVGNGWFRCGFTAVFSTAPTTVRMQVYTVDSANATTYTGDGTSGLFVWGAQLVAGTAPGAYTKTVAAAITTAAPALIDAPNGTAEALPASVTPPRNGDMVIEATSNTTLTFKLRGTDGTVRSGTLTLA